MESKPSSKLGTWYRVRIRKSYAIGDEKRARQSWDITANHTASQVVDILLEHHTPPSKWVADRVTNRMCFCDGEYCAWWWKGNDMVVVETASGHLKRKELPR